MHIPWYYFAAVTPSLMGQGPVMPVMEHGQVLQKASKLHEAVPCFEQAAAEFAAKGDRRSESLAMDSLGCCLYRLGEFVRAFNAFQRCTDLARILKDRHMETQSIANLAACEDELGRMDQARAHYREAIRCFRELGDLKEEANVRGNFGTMEYLAGNYSEARREMEESLEMHKKLGDEDEQPELMQSLGQLYVDTDEHDLAKATLERALQIVRRTQDSTVEAAILNALGSQMFALDSVERALDFFQQKLELQRRIGLEAGQAVSHQNLGRCLWRLSQKALVRGERETASQQQRQAVLELEEALRLHRKYNNRRGEAVALTGLAQFHTKAHAYPQARQALEQCLFIQREIQDLEGEAVALSRLGDLTGEEGHWEESLPFFLEALWLHRKVGEPRQETATHDRLMEAFGQMGERRLAILHGKQAVGLIQAARGTMVSLQSSTQKTYLGGHEPTFRRLAELLIQEGRLVEAQDVIKLLKEEEYTVFIHEKPSTPSRARSLLLTAQEQDWETRMREAGDRLSLIRHDLSRLGPMEETPEQESRHALLNAKLVMAAEGVDRIRREIGARTERSKPLVIPGHYQQMANREHVAILQFVATPDRVWAVATLPGRQLAHSLTVPELELCDKVQRFRRLVQDPAQDPRPLGKELYRMLIGPFTEDLRRTHCHSLLMGLDGVLRYLPTSALYDGRHFLAETFNLALLNEAVQKVAAHPVRHGQHFEGFGITQGGDGFSPLPCVADELGQILGLCQRNHVPGEIHLDKRFTESRLQAALKNRTSVVHIATHFVLTPGGKTQSFLVLGSGSRLTLRDLCRHDFPFEGMDLLVLSACETALDIGTDAHGSEVEGIGTLVQQKGAKSVMATLWPVADTSTSILMRAFYQDYLKGQGKAESLRRAQRALIHTSGTRKDFSHPFYWAPFVLMGCPD